MQGPDLTYHILIVLWQQRDNMPLDFRRDTALGELHLGASFLDGFFNGIEGGGF